MFFFSGVKFTSPLNASLIMGLNPAFTLILSFFILKSRIRKDHLFGILLAFFGVIYLLTQGNFTELSNLKLAKGDGLMFIANIIFAFYNVWVKQASGSMSRMHFTLLTNTICLLGFAVILPWMIGGTHISLSYSRAYWLSALGMGVLGTALAYYMWNIGVENKGPAQAGIFSNVTPLAAGVFAVFFGESIHNYHLVSGFLIISGIIFLQRGNPKR